MLCVISFTPRTPTYAVSSISVGVSSLWRPRLYCIEYGFCMCGSKTENTLTTPFLTLFAATTWRKSSLYRGHFRLAATMSCCDRADRKGTLGALCVDCRIAPGCWALNITPNPPRITVLLLVAGL